MNGRDSAVTAIRALARPAAGRASADETGIGVGACEGSH